MLIEELLISAQDDNMIVDLFTPKNYLAHSPYSTITSLVGDTNFLYGLSTNIFKKSVPLTPQPGPWPRFRNSKSWLLGIVRLMSLL
jgi:hypothetical protein